MSRNENHSSREGGRLRRAAAAVKRVFTRPPAEEPEIERTAAPQPSSERSTAPRARATRRESDIPLEALDRAYTPPVTSSKASFRSDGADHQLDQEYALGATDERWNDEDRMTNRSGDPRIGTHGRSYEPAAPRDESRESK